MTARLHHVAVTVTDMDASVACPITDHDWGSSLNFRDPDDLQLQLVVFAGM